MDNVIFMSELEKASSNIFDKAKNFSNSVNSIVNNSNTLTNLVTNLSNKIYPNKKVIVPDWNSIIYKSITSNEYFTFNFDGAIYIHAWVYKEDSYDSIYVSNNQSISFNQREYINGREEMLSNIAIPVYKGIKYYISCGDNFTIHGRLVDLQDGLIERD